MTSLIFLESMLEDKNWERLVKRYNTITNIINTVIFDRDVLLEDDEI